MKPTHIFVTFITLFATTVMASPIPESISVEERQYACILDACDVACKLRGNPKSGHCDRELILGFIQIAHENLLYDLYLAFTCVCLH